MCMKSIRKVLHKIQKADSARWDYSVYVVNIELIERELFNEILYNFEL